jgi:ribosome-associated heat shock protein Hsp15
MRVDKYLWCVRLFKTRSLATKACDTGKILLEGNPVKPAKVLKVGDRFSFKREGGAVFTYQVLGFPANRVGAPLVQGFLQDLTPEDEKQKLTDFQLVQKEYRDQGFGKPSKKDKRNYRKFLGLDG